MKLDGDLAALVVLEADQPAAQAEILCMSVAETVGQRIDPVGDCRELQNWGSRQANIILALLKIAETLDQKPERPDYSQQCQKKQEENQQIYSDSHQGKFDERVPNILNIVGHLGSENHAAKLATADFDRQLLPGGRWN